MPPPAQAVILVPGGLGTQLFLGTRCVWNFDPLAFQFQGVRMLANPALLLPWLPLQPRDLLSNYDDLITFIENQGYTLDTDLFLCGYDWRLGMQANAIRLAEFVDALPVAAGTQLVFISHSAGTMMVRWSLHLDANGQPGVPLIDNARVAHVVAAGPPMLGMPCAFKDILTMPRLDDMFDKLFALMSVMFPTLAALTRVPLCRSLMTVTGQLEGLPPNTIPVFSGGSTPMLGPFGAFDWHGWPPELLTLRGAVMTARGQLHAVGWGAVPCMVVASQDHPTDTGYVLNPQDEYDSDWAPGWGDGSVLSQSAQAYAATANLVWVNERHRTLLDDPIARTAMQAIL